MSIVRSASLRAARSALSLTWMTKRRAGSGTLRLSAPIGRPIPSVMRWAKLAPSRQAIARLRILGFFAGEPRRHDLDRRHDSLAPSAFPQP